MAKQIKIVATGAAKVGDVVRNGSGFARIVKLASMKSAGTSGLIWICTPASQADYEAFMAPKLEAARLARVANIQQTVRSMFLDRETLTGIELKKWCRFPGSDSDTYTLDTALQACEAAT